MPCPPNKDKKHHKCQRSGPQYDFWQPQKSRKSCKDIQHFEVKISPYIEIILKVEQTDNFDLRIGRLNSVFCLFFCLGLAFKNSQLLPKISVIVVLCLSNKYKNVA